MENIVQLTPKPVKNILLNHCKKKFVYPKYQSFYRLEFNVGKDMWKHIYNQKIKLAINRNIAEFNFKLMHNLLSCRKNLF